MQTLHFARDAAGIPHMRDRDIDVDTEMILRDYKPELLHTPQELDIEVFVEEYFGLYVHFQNLSNSGFIWGCMVFDNVQIPVFQPESNTAVDCPIDANTIVVDNQRLADESTHTCRSTIAHESGHWVYHKQLYALRVANGRVTNRAKGFTRCNRNDVTFGKGHKPLITENDWVEHQAKYYGSALLMPKSSVELLCHDPSTDKRVNSWLLCDSASERNRTLANIVSETYNVSRTSARIRIEQLRLAYQPSADEIKRRNTCWTPDEAPIVRQPRLDDLDAQVEAYYDRLYRKVYC